MTAKHVVVDGSNIATEGRNLPSLQQLDEAVRAFLDERPHETCIVVVDATFEHRIDSSEKKTYDEALAAGELITPPAGTIGRGDKFLLEIADRADATVFSNDSFQEFHGEYEWLFDAGRLVGGKPVPGIGWIFTERTPVRGPKSRMATRAASRKRSKAASAPSAKKASKASPRKAPAEPAAPSSRSRSGRRRGGRATPEPEAPAPAPSPGGRAGRRRGGRSAPEPVNEPLPFIEFIADHPVGTRVEGEVTEFSSHGAYINVGPVRCYAALKHLGDPPPRSAREVLERGETRMFIVQALDAPRRGIDLALPGFEQIEADAELAPPAEPPAPRKRSGARRAATKQPAEAETAPVVAAADQAPVEAGANQPEGEATLATTPARKGSAKKTAAAKKSTAKKATTKKSAARKAPAKKSTAKRSTAKKSTAKRSAAKKSTAKRSTAKKSAKKSTAKKSAKKSTAKKSTAKKSTAKKKAPARKSTAKKSTTSRGARKA